MAETVEEQMLYGRHCVHGTNIGTPGGADLMCGLCEMGYDTWVAEPEWQMRVTWTHVEGSPEWTVDFHYPIASEHVPASTVSRYLMDLLAYHRKYTTILSGEAQMVPTYEMVRVAEGRWEDA